jgi:hypothetical protein
MSGAPARLAFRSLSAQTGPMARTSDPWAAGSAGFIAATSKVRGAGPVSAGAIGRQKVADVPSLFVRAIIVCVPPPWHQANPACPTRPP